MTTRQFFGFLLTLSFGMLIASPAISMDRVGAGAFAEPQGSESLAREGEAETTGSGTRQSEADRTTPWRVAEIYLATMGYAPDADGHGYWIENIQTDPAWNPTTVAQSFFDQPLVQAEYPAHLGYGPLIEALYLNIFDRTPDSVGYSYWLGELQSGRVLRDQMIIALIEGGWANPEAATDMARFGNRIRVALAFAEAQRDLGIVYGSLSLEDQERLRQAGRDVVEGIGSGPNDHLIGIARINELLQGIAGGGTGADDVRLGQPIEIYLDQYATTTNTDAEGLATLDAVSFDRPVRLEVTNELGHALGNRIVEYEQKQGLVQIVIADPAGSALPVYYKADFSEIRYDPETGQILNLTGDYSLFSSGYRRAFSSPQDIVVEPQIVVVAGAVIVIKIGLKTYSAYHAYKALSAGVSLGTFIFDSFSHYDIREGVLVFETTYGKLSSEGFPAGLNMANSIVSAVAGYKKAASKLTIGKGAKILGEGAGDKVLDTMAQSIIDAILPMVMPDDTKLRFTVNVVSGIELAPGVASWSHITVEIIDDDRSVVWDPTDEVIVVRAPSNSQVVSHSFGSLTCSQAGQVWEVLDMAAGELRFRVPNARGSWAAPSSNQCTITYTGTDGVNRIVVNRVIEFDLQAIGAAGMIRFPSRDTHVSRATSYWTGNRAWSYCNTQTRSFGWGGEHYGTRLWIQDAVTYRRDFDSATECYIYFMEGSGALESDDPFELLPGRGREIWTERELSALTPIGVQAFESWDGTQADFVVRTEIVEVLSRNMYQRKMIWSGPRSSTGALQGPALEEWQTVEFVSKNSVTKPKVEDYFFPLRVYNAFDGACNGTGGHFSVYVDGIRQGRVNAGNHITIDVRGGTRKIGFDWGDTGEITFSRDYRHTSSWWRRWGCDDGTWPGNAGSVQALAQPSTRGQISSGVLPEPQFPATWVSAPGSIVPGSGE